VKILKKYKRFAKISCSTCNSELKLEPDDIKSESHELRDSYYTVTYFKCDACKAVNNITKTIEWQFEEEIEDKNEK
jgi:predicted  nucleic acid-binding Zn ribbon protein